MKQKTQQRISVGEVTRRGKLRLDSLFTIFQEQAVQHTHQAGFELKDLLDSRKTWILNRVAVEISSLPGLEESVDVFTWSRKIYRFKGIRDYEIFSGGESIIRATSLWIYFDAGKGRPVRVPDYFEEKYGKTEEQATGLDIESIHPDDISRPDLSLSIATRISDYDINGHVNNAAILQFIETGIYRTTTEENAIDRIQLVFQNEIPFNIDQVDVLIQRDDSRCLFEVRNGEALFVRGAATMRS